MDYRQIIHYSHDKIFPLLTEPQLKTLTVKYNNNRERQTIAKFGKSKNRTAKALRQIYDSEPNLNKQFISFKYSRPLNPLKLNENSESEIHKSTLNSPIKRHTTEFFDFKFQDKDFQLKRKYPTSKMTYTELPKTEEVKLEFLKIPNKESGLKMKDFARKLRNYNRKKKVLSINPSNRNHKIEGTKILVPEPLRGISKEVDSWSSQTLKLLPINSIVSPQIKKFISVCTSKDQKFQKYKYSEFIFKNRQITKRNQLQKIKVV